MVRLFLFSLLLALGYGFLRIFLRQLKQGPRRSAPPPTQAQPGEEMVRDPACGTYLPTSNAIADEVGGQRHYFCSAACRDAYRVKS